jgi:beta-carotene hydroxylase
MLLRYRSDIRTLVWCFALMPGLALAQLLRPSLAPWLLPLSMYASYAAAVVAHNHNHCPTFTKRSMNALFASWISIFYGFPTYGWIPTHNENHHRHRGRDGDATVVVVRGQRDSFSLAATHFFRTTRTQAPLLAHYRAKLRRRSFRAWLGIWLQYVAVYGAHVAFLAFAIALHGPWGAVVYLSALGVPAFFALWAIMLTNWCQHVECDVGSKWNHSRNFVAPWFNALVFDNGFHTIHHEKPGLHWSETRRGHQEIAHRIDPKLLVSSPFRYFVDAWIRRRDRRHDQRVRRRSVAPDAVSGAADVDLGRRRAV